jgi:type IV pilus assembly protein PilM
MLGVRLLKMGTTIKNNNLFLRDKPLFGLDLGHGSAKVMQVDPMTVHQPKGARLIGYGTVTFDPSAIVNGVIEKPVLIAEAVKKLFTSELVGDITTSRVAMALPSYRTYSQPLQLPTAREKELRESVDLEMQQYIPVGLDELYTDYSVTSRTKEFTNIHTVAAPRHIVDSYVDLAHILGLEPILVETTMNAASRLFRHDTHSDLASVIIDFGAESSDISIFDNDVLVTGTVSSGGNTFTEIIKNKLDVSTAEATIIKTKYGLNLSKKQKQIQEALEPKLHEIVREIQRMTRYYEERFGHEKPLSQVISIGGGANMPGLSDYLVSELRMPVRTYDPWNRLNYAGLTAPSHTERATFTTAAGLSLCSPKEVFNA